MLKARQRRRIHLGVAGFWLGPGALISWLYPHSIPWLIFMSWFTCWYSVMAAWAAETPVEPEHE